MKFFFPDSQDQIDPGFDFGKEEYSPGRMRQRHDKYTHEVLGPGVYAGILVSKAVVDGVGGLVGKYSFSQRQRFYREGVRKFFRLEPPELADVLTFGDCGAFSYVHEEEPPYTIDEVLDFYENGGFDWGVSIDHVILGFRTPAKSAVPGLDSVPDEWRVRQAMTIDLAQKCHARHRARGCSFELLGAAQGWDVESYRESVAALEEIGYTRIALGGLVPLKTPDLVALVTALGETRRDGTEFHLFGISRTECLDDFARSGVTSFDSTSAFRKAFKDNRNNYHFYDRNYTAIRIPMVDGSPKLKRAILAGEVSSTVAAKQERACLEAVDAYEQGELSVDDVIRELALYEEICGEKKSRCSEYRETLEAAPWRACPCDICRAAGIHVAVFRGSERNKRRGMHNLHVFAAKMSGKGTATRGQSREND